MNALSGAAIGDIYLGPTVLGLPHLDQIPDFCRAGRLSFKCPALCFAGPPGMGYTRLTAGPQAGRTLMHIYQHWLVLQVGMGGWYGYHER